MHGDRTSMKRNILQLPAVFGLLFLLFSGCNPVNRTDIQHLISPSALPYLKNSKMIQVSSYDTSGGNQDRITIPAGKKATILDVEGPGMIVRIWFSVESPDPYYLRRLVLRMFWDNETKPSVEVPIGDFFGCGYKYVGYASQYLGMTGNGFVCYFPMPFERQARIEILNETRYEVPGLFYQINYQKFEGALDSDVAYFHAFWNRSVTTRYDSNYTLLKTEGKGHVVGVNMNIQSYDGTLDFLDGDEMIYVDGEKKPSIRGTGTADFFSGGLNFSAGTYNTPFNGLIFKDDSAGQVSAYRLFISDQISFKKNIRVTMEHGHGNKRTADYSSTIYWYHMESHAPVPALPRAGQRIPLRMVKPAGMVEAESLTIHSGGLRSNVMDMSDEGADWSGNHQLFIETRNQTDFELLITGKKPGKYVVDLYYTVGPVYGNADVYVNGARSGSILGYSPYLLPMGKIRLEGSPTSDGVINLKFRITGKDPSSNGFNVGIDGVFLSPISSNKL